MSARWLLVAICVGAGDGLVLPAGQRLAHGGAQPKMQLTPQSWDARRALKTALFFNGPAQILDRFGLGPRKPSRPEGLLWSASTPELAQWGQLDDVVRHGYHMRQCDPEFGT